MRELIDGKDTYKIPEKQYKQLLKRFDVSKARLDSTGGMIIRLSCICSVYFSHCKRCCLVNNGRVTNCLVIMEHLAGKMPANLCLDTGYIAWPSHNRSAPTYIQKVREVLLALPQKKDTEQQKTYHRKYYMTHKEKYLASSLVWARVNRARRNAIALRSYHKMRKEAKESR